ncbi:hypothetical protein ANCDUO_03016 [Ancylostoma duodenale]|uniref:Uncharacterized protein n=1 Tax=Ancylostoma duodenale TaxID=51022 RepID=A0A0C2DUY0_9BILA|nr:hypothetical protein ANCDUO_03016 [Ancylostoma duodenale]
MCEPPEATISPIRQFHDVLVNFIERRAELWLRLAEYCMNRNQVHANTDSEKCFHEELDSSNII